MHKKRIAKQTSEIYAQNEGILFQFILHEFLKSHALIEGIRSSANPEKDFAMLVGHDHKDDSRSYACFWTEQIGSLKNLKTYISLLSVHFPAVNNANDPDYKNLFQCVVTMSHALFDFHNCPYHEEKIKKGERLNRALKKMSRSLHNRLHRYCEDENVLLFLIKSHREFSQIFGSAAMAKLMKLKGGINELQAFLLERYSKRGFDHLLPLIRETITYTQA